MAFENYTVNSSNLAAVEYDPDTLVLRVTFKNGGQYEYEGVTHTVILPLLLYKLSVLLLKRQV